MAVIIVGGNVHDARAGATAFRLTRQEHLRYIQGAPYVQVHKTCAKDTHMYVQKTPMYVCKSNHDERCQHRAIRNEFRHALGVFFAASVLTRVNVQPRGVLAATSDKDPRRTTLTDLMRAAGDPRAAPSRALGVKPVHGHAHIYRQTVCV